MRERILKPKMSLIYFTLEDSFTLFNFFKTLNSSFVNSKRKIAARFNNF